MYYTYMVHVCSHVNPNQPPQRVRPLVFMSTGPVERGAGVATSWDLWSSQGDRSPTRNLNCYGRGLRLGIGARFFWEKGPESFKGATLKWRS